MKTTKVCSKCSIAKLDTDFYSARSGICIPCKQAWQRAYTAKLRGDPIKYAKYLSYQKKYQARTGREHRAKRFGWLDEIKADPCMDCGRAFPPECMDFDHRDPSVKLFNVSGAAVSGRSLESVRAEVAKCDLVCACCHRIRTARQQGFKSRRYLGT